MMASMATQCGETPRGTVPTMIGQVDLVLDSVPEPLPADLDTLVPCLNRMDGLQNHVRPSWRASFSDPTGEVVLFTERFPNVFAVTFLDVPVDFVNTMTVHDTNECTRDPAGSGHVTMGVTVNGTPVTTIVGSDNVLSFDLNPDGSIKPQASATAGP